jgi:hypothetical protein
MPARRMPSSVRLVRKRTHGTDTIFSIRVECIVATCACGQTTTHHADHCEPASLIHLGCSAHAPAALTRCTRAIVCVGDEHTLVVRNTLHRSIRIVWYDSERSEESGVCEQPWAQSRCTSIAAHQHGSSTGSICRVVRCLQPTPNLQLAPSCRIAVAASFSVVRLADSLSSPQPPQNGWVHQVHSRVRAR